MGKKRYQKCKGCGGEIYNRGKSARYHKICYILKQKEQQTKYRLRRKQNE